MKRAFLPILLILTAFHLLIAWLMPPSEDELYYWCWSQKLQWSYFDHPAMVAVLIRLSTEIFGNTLFAIRFPACVCSLVTLLILRGITRDDWLLLPALLTPLVLFGMILMTPDAPLTVFWAAYVWWLIASHERLARRETPRWILGGVIFGLGFLSKYPMALAAPAAVLSVVLLPSGRHWRVAGGFLTHYLTAALVACPILIHNLRHDFAPLRFQWNHANEQGARLFAHFPEFLAGQIGLIGTGPLLLFFWGMLRYRRLQDSPRAWAAAWLFVLPMSVFLLKSVTGRLEPNWPVFCYLSCGVMGVEMLRQSARPERLRKWVTASFAIPILVSVVLGVYMAVPLPFVPPEKDRFARFQAYATMNRDVANRVRELTASGELPAGTPIYGMRYQATAMLRFEGLDARQYPLFTRPSYFTQEADDLTTHESMCVFSEWGPLSPEILAGFGNPRILAEFPLLVRDREVSRHMLIFYDRKRTADPSAR